ncbi:MAG TPA: SIMPL domain-containing protein [Candidatus Paceibacterota bacterium]|nr:SIMPL domain-containing protein [Candidatus Paceibacterota bacterium]
METFLNDKKISVSVFILLVIVSLFTVAKLVNEVKQSPYVGRGAQPSNVISVTGSGEVTAVSDIATLNINLSKDGKTAKEAQDALNQSIEKTLAYLKDQKIEDKDIKSEYGGLSPKYSYEDKIYCITYPCPVRDPKIVGYTATQSITVKVREVDNASTIRTGLAGIGITDINGPTFSIDDEEGFKDEARSLAIKEARDKAEVLAKELGVKLGKVVTFSENGNYYPMYAKSMMGTGDAVSAQEAAPTLPKGENKITSNVTITYEIR